MRDCIYTAIHALARHLYIILYRLHNYIYNNYHNTSLACVCICMCKCYQLLTASSSLLVYLIIIIIYILANFLCLCRLPTAGISTASTPRRAPPRIPCPTPPPCPEIQTFNNKSVSPPVLVALLYYVIGCRSKHEL